MFKNELKKIYTNILIYISILVTGLIFMSGTVYRSIMDSKEYNLFMLTDEEFRAGNEWDIVPDFSQAVMFGPNSYMNIFSMIIVSIPFTMLVSSEKKNSNTRFEIIRVGRFKYTLGKFLAVITSGGTVMVAGYLIYVIACYFILPETRTEMFSFEFTGNNSLSIFIYENIGFAGLYIFKMLLMFCYGMVSVLMAFLLSAFMKNRYLILCIPFILNYIYVTYTSTISKVYIPRFEDLQYVYRYENDDAITLLAMVVLSMIISFVVYKVIIDRKCDCGE